MTWTKLSDDFSDECHTLSDAAFRTHVEALIWVMRRETGGHIEARDLKRFAESPHVDLAVTELVSCGWWSVEAQGYRIRHHMEHQPEPDLIAKRRELTAERVKKHRRKKAGLDQESASVSASRPDPSRPVPGNPSSNAVTPGWPEVMEAR
ncbi:hypothetical protein [Nocardioides xinjiangensis]|uniref:hypothetical protein n=1 Tax=Nocardioides xinjiangensis TaxID=2817376 RepID=UPI001B3010E1|nr:hypothetical protein [Nocardioides sp. SYSU D00514]